MLFGEGKQILMQRAYQREVGPEGRTGLAQCLAGPVFGFLEAAHADQRTCLDIVKSPQVGVRRAQPYRGLDRLQRGGVSRRVNHHAGEPEIGTPETRVEIDRGLDLSWFSSDVLLE